MKKFFLLVFATLLVFSLNAQISFNTGSASFDLELNQMNVEAKADLSSFKTSLSIDFGQKEAEIEKLFNLKMEPAEVFLSLSIADVVHKPVSEVAESYKVNKGKGWGYIAKQMGIKPGSPEFHALKGKRSKKSSQGKGNSGKGKGNGKAKK